MPSESRRFPIKLLRIVFVATAILLTATVAVRIGIQVHRQKMVLQEFKRLGVMAGTDVTGPEWLRHWIGAENIEAFGNVTSIQVGGWRGPDNEVLRVGATDEHVRLFEDLHHLTHLFLDGTEITDDGLRYLGRMSKLRMLNLEGTDITDAGIVHLKPLRSLKVLFIRDSRITDAGIAELKLALPDLHVVE